MGETLKLKSRASKVYDIRQVDISQFLTGFTVDEARYRRDLERLLRRFGTKTEADVVSEGDSVIVSCSSTMQRYNKTSLPVVVGKGIFNPVVEAALVGMALGETKTVTVHGYDRRFPDYDVTLTVKKILHTVLPELTDATVASFGLEGISTVADLRAFCVGRQVETFILDDEAADMASAYVWQEIAKNSQVERDYDELCFQFEKAKRKMAEIDAMPKDGEEDAGITIEMLVQMYTNELDLAAVGQHMMEEDGVCLTEDDYVGQIDKLVEAYPGKTRDEIESEAPRLEFTIVRSAEYLARAIDEYVASEFKEHFTKE